LEAMDRVCGGGGGGGDGGDDDDDDCHCYFGLPQSFYISEVVC
jgi:hypothetical protein